MYIVSAEFTDQHATADCEKLVAIAPGASTVVDLSSTVPVGDEGYDWLNLKVRRTFNAAGQIPLGDLIATFIGNSFPVVGLANEGQPEWNMAGTKF